MNIHNIACMTAHPVFQINGNFTMYEKPLSAHAQILTLNWLIHVYNDKSYNLRVCIDQEYELRFSLGINQKC